MTIRKSYLPYRPDRPCVLDLFCGAGGCSMGYYMAGFNVLGVDLFDQPNYPFSFVRADALTYPLEGIAAVHASPPCQGYSRTVHPNKHRKSYPMLIEPVRERLAQSGLPYIIEMVSAGPLRDSVVLCGAMFGLKVYRHRHFETNFAVEQPRHETHRAQCANSRQFKGVRLPKPGQFYTVAGNFGHIKFAREAMGITWMRQRELSQAIPPTYTLFVGNYLLRHLAKSPD